MRTCCLCEVGTMYSAPWSPYQYFAVITMKTTRHMKEHQTYSCFIKRLKRFGWNFFEPLSIQHTTRYTTGSRAELRNVISNKHTLSSRRVTDEFVSRTGYSFTEDLNPYLHYITHCVVLRRIRYHIEKKNASLKTVNFKTICILCYITNFFAG
jgi:hypothetical protein